MKNILWYTTLNPLNVVKITSESESFLTATYNITNVGVNNVVGNRNATQYFTAFEENCIAMWVDGEQVEPSMTYNFTTTGEHTVKFQFKTSIDSMYRMFDSGSAPIVPVTKVDFSKFRSENVETMEYAFQFVKTINQIDGLNYIDTSKVTNMNALFYTVSVPLTKLNGLENWDVSNVTTFRNTFRTPYLTSVNLTNWNPKNATTTEYMFYEDKVLTSVGNLSNWNTENLQDAQYMFFSCESLVDVGNLDNWNTSKLTNMNFMFDTCKNLTNVGDWSNWDLSNVTSTRCLFQQCFALKNIVLPDSLKVIDSFAFNHATGYEHETFEIPSGCTRMGYAHLFYDFGKPNVFKRFIVRDGNTSFKTDERGALYSMDGTELLAIPRAI